jgi:hypothetical protein
MRNPALMDPTPTARGRWRSARWGRWFSIGSVTLAVGVFPARSASAFVMHDVYWFEVFLRFGFDLGTGGVTRFGLGMEVSPANTDLLLGGTFGFAAKKNPMLDLTFDVGYCLGVNSVKPVAVPVFAKFGLVDSTIGMILAGGVQGLVPAHVGWNLNMEGLGTYRLRLAKPEYGEPTSVGLDFGLGFATPQGKGGGADGYTYYTYYY